MNEFSCTYTTQFLHVFDSVLCFSVRDFHSNGMARQCMCFETRSETVINVSLAINKIKYECFYFFSLVDWCNNSIMEQKRWCENSKCKWWRDLIISVIFLYNFCDLTENWVFKCIYIIEFVSWSEWHNIILWDLRLELKMLFKHFYYEEFNVIIIFFYYKYYYSM